MNKSKVEAIMSWSEPMNFKQLREFLGLTGYYRKFIKGYATLAAPLSNLLKKDNFIWNTKTKQTYDDLKETVTQPPLLILPDFS